MSAFVDRSRMILVSLGVGLSMAGSALGGPLTPPAGPVTSTGKTLTEVEPRIAINATNTPGTATGLYRITQAGSYYLTGNVAGVAGKNGIEIAVAGVTIDLAGFEVVGTGGGAGDGIVAVGPFTVQNVTLSNGTIRNWGGDGIDLLGVTVAGFRITDLVVQGNGGSGMTLGATGTVSGCTARSNTSAGIRSLGTIVLTGCVAANNSGGGIILGGGAVVSQCTATANVGGPGISAGTGATITGCSATSNAQGGIVLTNVGKITGCFAQGNQLFGISAQTGGSSVQDCTLISNIGDGVQVGLRSSVTGCQCISNRLAAGTAAGIRVTSTGSRVEGNHCVDNDRGFEATAPSNVFFRNTAGGNNTNWIIPGGNVCFVIQPNNNLAINGNTGGAATSPIDPTANFSF